MNKEQFIKEFSQELYDGNGVYFIGAGISKASHLPGWLELLKPFSDQLGITNIEEKDLPLIAQYIINENAGNRGPFITSISKKLRRKVSPNKYHDHITKTNLYSIWTTNYDRLIEDAFTDVIKDIKFNDDSISRIVPDAQLEIIKLHGCIFNSPVDEIVITEADFEDFFIKRPATTQRLRMDFLRKSFLFIGYGYKDQNIKNIIVEARRLANNATRQHYLVMIDQKTHEYKLWCNDLNRVGINVINIDNYTELEEILEKLSLASRGKSVFVTGSHSSTHSKEAKKLGEIFAHDNDLLLLDGQSSGIMRVVVSSFMEKCILEKMDISKRLRFFPNPYAANEDFKDDVTLLPLLKQWRSDLLKAAHIVVAFDGGMGTAAEIERAKELGCFIIPFPVSDDGSATRCLNEVEIRAKIDKVWPDYLNKWKSKTLEVDDVYTLICRIFEFGLCKINLE